MPMFMQHRIRHLSLFTMISCSFREVFGANYNTAVDKWCDSNIICLTMRYIDNSS